MQANTHPDLEPGIIRTYTGKMINVLDPDPALICIEDIAHALSNQCRFSGHTSKFYSVAQHSVLCAKMVSSQFKLAALLHDASEAYLVDLPTPIKIAIPQYTEIEGNMMRVIANKFGFDYPLSAIVKYADKAALEIEWKGLILSSKLLSIQPFDAETLFMYSFNNLK